jgi:hypothetical protein
MFEIHANRRFENFGSAEAGCRARLYSAGERPASVFMTWQSLKKMRPICAFQMSGFVDERSTNNRLPSVRSLRFYVGNLRNKVQFESEKTIPMFIERRMGKKE